MEITWYGQSCFKIKGKSSSAIIDPFDPEMVGLKLPKDFTSEVVLVTHQHGDHNFVSAVSGNPVVISGPGEYEVAKISINGIQSFHDAEQGAQRGKNTIYHILVDDVNVVHLGDLGHPLTESQIEEIETADILLIPVGGNYTIDASAAAKVVASLEPRIVIPMHYKIEGLKVDVGGLDDFLKQMGAESVEAIPKLSTTKDKLPEETQVVVLSKS